MIDWHSHILPGIDDGSKSVEESLALIRLLREQGVDTVIATPHFLANDESADDFVLRRQKSFESLCGVLPETAPSIRLGAEVRYYPGIGRFSSLERLCIEGTELFLLEMPMGKWTDYTVRELVEIANARKVKLILAHIERYWPMQNGNTWEELYNAGIIMQANASFFADFATRRKAFSLFRDGAIHLIGSDCHNLRYRPPQMGKANEYLRRKFGDEFVSRFDEYGEAMLKSI